MSDLFRAMNANVTTTENGMPAYEGSMDNHVDLFFKLGSARGLFGAIAPIISKSAAENLDLAVRILLHGRDVREGAGERQTFKDAIKLLFNQRLINEKAGNRIADRIPDLGRWDDLLAFIGTPSENYALSLIARALEAGSALCAKWMPREKNNPPVARKLMQMMGMTPKQYRKLIVRLTNVVENQMCANEWTEINYGHVPSLASARYQKAFGRHNPVGYAAYLASLQKGEAKINAGAIYPYDVVKSVAYGNAAVADEQWKALPNYFGNDFLSTLVVADTSGSMTCKAGGYASKSNTTCLDVCISLALYLSERNKGIFKDKFITFSSHPELQTIKGTLTQRVNQLKHAHWEMNTNIRAVFELILNSAMKNHLPQDQMPSRILILSDMQFDRCGGGAYDMKAHELIEAMYRAAGYQVPQLVFWNLNSAYNNTSVEFDKKGTALVSGFSPSIMKGVLAADMDNFSPVAIMNKTVMVERYEW